MINRILALLAISTVASYGAANDLLIAQRNSTDTGQLTRLVAHPGGSQNGFVVYNGTSLLPQIVLLGDGLSWGSGQVNVTMSSDMTAALATKQDSISSGTTSDYWRGDHSWAAFPSIPAAQVNSDWSSSSGLSQILNKPSLATVATSGAYADLSGKPTIPASQVQTDWNAVSGIGVLLNKPSLATVATSGNYSDLSGKPTLSTVATSGAYADLSGKPSIPSAQVNSDWTAVSGISQILNKPSLATVATSGSYNDLSSKPTMPSAQIQSDWTQTNSGSVDFIKNKPVASTSTASRSFNSAFQVSTTKNAQVYYTVEIGSSISLSGTNAGSIYLETSPDNSTWTEEGRITNSQGGGLVIGLSLSQNFAAQLTAYVPSSYYVRIRSVSTAGTATFTLQKARETTLS